MEPATAARLIQLNKQFYQTFGGEFSATRQRLQPGVKRIMEKLTSARSILDLGCGNGELARELSRRGFSGGYLGLDFSQPLLSKAQGLSSHYSFAETDLTIPGWEKKLPADHYARITAFATLHHIPSRHLRLDLIKIIHTLLETGGLFIHSQWQFLNSEKLKQRVQPWNEAGLIEAEVDPNDYLLDWRGGGCGLRYVHHYNETELEDLASMTGFRVCETFFSDGENGRLGLYQIWEKQ